MLISFNVNKNISFLDFMNSYTNKLIRPFQDLKSYHTAYKNYFYVLRKKMLNRYPINVIQKNNLKLKVSNLNELRISKWCGVNNCMFQNDMLILNKKDFPEIKLVDWEDNGDVRRIFFEDEYKFLDVKNKIVVDIGANIADTAIYFALCGAKKVIAIEPAPKNYESAKKNIQLNGLENKIKLLLAGCSSKKGEIQINSTKSGIGYSLEIDGTDKIEVPLLGLKDLIKEYLLSPLVLKIDCEGWEYEIILNAECEILRKFSHIQIEYHLGYKNLKEKLENCGFKVHNTSPNFGERIFYKKQKTFVGYIYAKRNNKN